MSALDSFSPAAVSVIKLFAYNFHAAPTADLIALFSGANPPATTTSAQLDFLYDYPVANSPFGAYASSSSNAAFVTALVDNFTFGTDISAQVKAGWVAQITPTLQVFATRGAFAAWVMGEVDHYAGDDANLIALRDALHARAEAAAAFAQSAPGAAYNGQGWAQLTTPLDPPPEPTYELTAGVAAANEGANVTFTLQTTHVAAGTTIAYTLSGTGISAADIAGGLLTGNLVVNSSGVATAIVTLANDLSTEGAETLRMTLAGNLDTAEVAINDTSVSPPQPTFAVSADLAAVNEGGLITYTLTTTNLAAGSPVAFTLSGTGITAADITGGALVGTLFVDAQGKATVSVGVTADATTEGAELLKFQLAGNVAGAEVLINDTSVAPPPTGGADTVVVADAMNNSNAHAPATPAEGEIPIDTYLSYDLLNQGGTSVTRMSIAALKASGPTAGAALDLTNQSADRGNVPQLSNQGLYTFDLGLQTDRVDYSAESGKIVAVLGSGAGTTQYVLVNDNAVDDVFNGATDRLDILKDVEEVVASKGGGVIDLTSSGKDWNIVFSSGFTPASDIDTSTDRATHRVAVTDAATGASSALRFIEFRDGGQSVNATQPTAAWLTVQGSDRNESLSFTDHQALEQRSNVLRGGTNAVKYSDLTRSVIVDVAIAPWLPSSSLADDSNASGRLTVTTRFSNGDGVTLLSGATHVSSSYTPDNGIAAGTLKLTATPDAEDAISFAGIAQPKIITLTGPQGNVDSTMRLVGAAGGAALELTWFEFLHDNGASDDLYVVENLTKALAGHPELVDAAGADHDAVKLTNQALGHAAVGGFGGTVDFAILNGGAFGFGYDFDVLDLSAVTATALQVLGTADGNDELVVGALASIGAVSSFEALVLTEASTDKGTSLTLDLDAGQLKAGLTTLFNYGGSIVSANGPVFSNAGQASYVAPMSTGMNITVIDATSGAGATVWGGSGADVITGGAGDDTLRGGAGNDTLDGGAPPAGSAFAETWDFTIAGTPDAVTAAANRIAITMTIDGTVLTLSEAAVADTAYGDGNGAVGDGASTIAIGQAMAALINANLAAINTGPGIGALTGASFDNASGVVRLSFRAGVNTNDAVSFVLNSGAGPDGGNFTLSSATNINGGNGGSDTFVFEKSGAANGTDLVQAFTANSDQLDVTAFTGAAITAAAASINAAAGGTLTGVATTAEFIFNKANGSLSASDFASAPAVGKFVIANGAKAVVAVTADPTGARGDATNTAVSLYYVENGPASGLGDLSVSLVGIISGPAELTLAEIFAALS